MTDNIVFGGGCFWCTEAVFRKLKGVLKVTSGYAGGNSDNPDYETVSMGNSGFAEVIEVEYDPKIISTEKLIEVFLVVHDPTSLNRQGADTGTQYRSVIFFTNDQQKKLAEEWKNKDKNIVTDIEPLTRFFAAEDYHQKYYEKNQGAPYCSIVIVPKLKKAEQLFGDIMRV